MELMAAEQCVEFLLNVRNHDKVLHSTVAVPDIRRLYSQLRGKLIPTSSDPSLYNAVLQLALKDMNPCLLSGIYDSLLVFDTLDEKDGITRLIAFIRGVLIKLPDRLFTLFQQICEVMYKSAQTATCLQLAANITPYLCRPKSGAFMSIRHMEDLRRLRPAIQFILENFMEVFDKLVSEEAIHGNAVGSHQNLKIDLSMQNMHIKKKVDIDSPELHLSYIGSPDHSHKASRSHDYDSIEWKILEALVAVKMKAFLSVPETPMRFTYSISKDQQDEPSEQQVKTEPTASASVEKQPLGKPPQRKTDMSQLGKPAQRTTDLFDSVVPSPRVSLLTGRRQIIADCKTVKTQIALFEQGYKDKHKTLPKESERGEMEAVYRSYRSMKRSIRSSAATDIQRMYRGMYVRRQIAALKSQISSIPMDMELDGDGIDSGSDYDAKEGARDHYLPSSDMQSIDSEDDSVHESLIGTLTNAISEVGFSSLEELLEVKRQMKDKLRAFDEAFLTARGQLPSKAEKEIMRPYYDQYQRVKLELQKMTEPASIASSKDDDIRRGRHAAALLSSKSESKLQVDAKSASHNDRPHSATVRRNVVDSNPLRRGQENRAKLFEEKRQLHAFLKSYEKGFTKAHGRPVVHTDDIKAVSDQYKRYKELKTITKKMDDKVE